MMKSEERQIVLFPYHPNGWAQTYGTTYVVPGNCFSANTAYLYFSVGHQFALYARWVLLWASQNVAARARLIYFDGGPSNIVPVRGILNNGSEVTELEGDGSMNAVVQEMNITDTFNMLVRKRADKQIGHQFKDNGSNGSILYKSYLEILY